MKFRRGGRISRDDPLYLDRQELGYVNEFTYLGVVLTTNGLPFTKYVNERYRKALVAATTIREPHLLSLRTALQLFNLKVAPTASYGMNLVWEYLSPSNFESLNWLKAAYLKTAWTPQFC